MYLTKDGRRFRLNTVVTCSSCGHPFIIVSGNLPVRCHRCKTPISYERYEVKSAQALVLGVCAYCGSMIKSGEGCKGCGARLT